MNETNPRTDINQTNPWAARGTFPPIKGIAVLLSVIVYFLCALALPLLSYAWVSFALLALLFFYVVWIARNPHTVTAVLVSTAVVTVLTASYAVGALYLSLLVGCMSGAFLLTTRRLPVLVTLLSPIAAAAIAYPLTGDVLTALFACAFLPAAALLAIATEGNRPRTSSLCFCIGGFLIAALIFCAAAVYLKTGALNAEAIKSTVQAVREDALHALISMRDEMLLRAKEAVIDEQTQGFYDQLVQLSTDRVLVDAVNMAFSLLPAAVIVVASVIAFFSQMLLLSSYRTVGWEKVLTPAARYLTVSVVASVLYALTFILMFLLPTGTVAYATVQNLCLILMPGLFLVGCQMLITMLARARGGMRAFVIAMVAGVLCC